MKTSTSLGTVVSAFQALWKRSPEQLLFTFADERGRDDEKVTAAELGEAASSIASALGGWGFRPGDRALLVYPPGPDFVRALLGCLAAGVVPVPVYPPNPVRLGSDLGGFRSIVDSCEPVAVLTSSAYDRARTVGAVTGFFDRSKPEWPRLRWHRTDRVRPASFDWHAASADDPALLQYTSGSTAAPKGVVITHGNLACEVAANAHDLGLGQDTVGVFWLPQYHDLGLISVILSTLTGNSHTYLLSPLSFLQRPALWFEVMSRVGATHTAAPNFAFELAVRKTSAEQRASWDLSALRVVMSAAEPIRVSTVDSFYAAFAVSGLLRSSFYPAYGLAEHTVSVSMGGQAVLHLDRASLQRGEVVQAADGLPVVGCGRITKPSSSVLIVDPSTGAVCAPDRVGEVWVTSGTKAAGYFGLPDETQRTFSAQVPGDERSYLRTGDLGFFHDGELFVTGRLKDVIIINGRNHYPQDVEDSVRDCHTSVRPGGVVAFGVPGEAGERLVLFVETREKKAPAEEIAEAVRRRVFETHGLAVDEVVVGAQGLVLKTTSGKVRRRACRQAFLEGRA
ncbi:fatty acyl-AMP ligase [Lentzea aerocolonigenes]|uniref:fatty acyl-AMP ligase n=1 Tax=Lentzea aerocolonigenes TaxID=68170 RepID=UPI0009E65CB7|nr:fatty acyl-AMP ligase [Lentzea aerocolonigenes]